MNLTETAYGTTTAQLVKTACDNGIDRKMVVMRHSARHYDFDNPIREPFLGLTTEGKDVSFNWGQSLPPNLHLNFFSSFISRCVETAYLIDKGYVAGGGTTEHAIMETTLAPYYVRDAVRLLDEHLRGPDFYGAWFGEKIPEDIIDPPKKIAARMRRFWEKRLLRDEPTNGSVEVATDSLDICITHDWNVYVILGAFFGLTPDAYDAAYGKINYLDGVVVFKDNDHLCIEAPDQAPAILK